MRRLLAPLLMLVLVFGTALPALAEEPPIQVTLEGEQLSFDVPPFISNGRTLVPVRALAEALGFAVDYDDPERRVTLTRRDEIILLWIDSDQVVVNGVPGTIDQPATLRESRTFVPVRFVSESLGAHVDWDQATWTVLLFAENPHKELLARAIKQMDLLLDQKSTGELNVKIELLDPSGAAIFALDMPISIDAHIFQNEMLQSITITPPLPFAAPEVTLMAIKDGTIYLKTPQSSEWRAVEKLETEGVIDLAEVKALDGLQLSVLLRADMLGESNVTKIGTSEMDGVTVTELHATVPPLMPEAVLEPLLALLGADETTEVALEEFTVTYWVDPVTAFVHQMHLALVLSEMGDTVSPTPMRFTIEGTFRYQPLSEPIDFPEL
jgi:hypothetical protein